MIKVSKVILNVFKKFSKDLMKFSNFAFCTWYGLKIVIGLNTKLCVEGCNQQPPAHPTTSPKQKKLPWEYTPNTEFSQHFQVLAEMLPKWQENIFFNFFQNFQTLAKMLLNNNEIFFSKFSSDC